MSRHDQDMDVDAVLTEACERARISRAELARRGGTTPAVLSAWARGRMSPTLTSLVRVLAGVGLELRASLAPLTEDLDQRVAEVSAGAVELDLARLRRVVETARLEQRWASESDDGSVVHETGRITWAFDGATALALHGMAFPQDVPGICLLFDDAARSWLTKGLMVSTVYGRISFWSATFAEARDHLSEMCVGGHGALRIRLVEQLPAVVRVMPDGVEAAEGPLPVIRVDAVAAAFPRLAEVLNRL